MMEKFWALLGWMNGFCTSKGHELLGAMGRMVSFLRWLIHQYFHFLKSRVSIQLSFFDLSIALGTIPNFTLKFSQFLSDSPIPVYPFSFSLNLTFTFSHFYLFFSLLAFQLTMMFLLNLIWKNWILSLCLMILLSVISSHLYLLLSIQN